MSRKLADVAIHLFRGSAKFEFDCSPFPCSALAVFGKVGVDQLLYTPVATGIFYATLDTLEGHPERLPQTLKVCPALVKTL